jgi:hypothetical protein
MVWKYAAGTAAMVPASPPLPPEIGMPVPAPVGPARRPPPSKSAEKLMALTSAWNWVSFMWRIAAGLVAITEASPGALPEPANARPRPLALFSFSWNAAPCA